MDMTVLHVWYVLAILVDYLPLSNTITTGFYADDSLQQTIPIPRLRHKQKEEMRDEILTVLGLDHVPQPVTRTYGKKRPPDFMLDLYNKLQNDEAVVGDGQLDAGQITMSNSSADPVNAINSADMIVSFHNHDYGRTRHRHDKERKLYFDFRDVALDEEITGAELRLYKAVTDKRRFMSEYFNVEVYRILPYSNHNKPSLQLEDTVVVNGSFEGWLVLNVSQAGIHWQIEPYDNLGLLLVVTDMTGKEINQKHVEILGMEASESRRPFMLGFFKQISVHSRSARSAKKRGKNRKRKENRGRNKKEPEYSLESPAQRYTMRQCQRKTLYVSFKDLGWQDWIIAPDGYSAYYCEGECSFPLNAHMNATNHAIVQTLVHLMNPFKIPKPCCAPTKLSAISVLYFDDDSNVILKKYRNMMVRSCGCH